LKLVVSGATFHGAAAFPIRTDYTTAFSFPVGTALAGVAVSGVNVRVTINL